MGMGSSLRSVRQDRNLIIVDDSQSDSGRWSGFAAFFLPPEVCLTGTSHSSMLQPRVSTRYHASRDR